MKDLAKESYDNRKGNLCGLGFLEKVSKKIEADKALAKVVHDATSQCKRSFEDDPKDFLSQGTPAQYGSKGNQRQFKQYNPNAKKGPRNKKAKPAHCQRK